MAKLIKAQMLTLESAKSLFHRANGLMRDTTFKVRQEKVLEYAAQSQASSYDCEFVALADDFGAKLITLDRALIAHFPDRAIHLTDYV
jgi:predicted nucleic acid-binding protein